MKKVIFASAAALCTFVGLSSFNADTRAALRYFNVTPQLASTVSELEADQVTFNSATNPGDVCSGATKLCIVSIETTYLTAGKQHIKPNIQAPIKTVISTRN